MIIPWKITVPFVLFPLSPFAIYTWLSRLAIYNYDGWEQNEYRLCPVNKRIWWLYSIPTASCCVLSRWAARFLDSRCRARLIAWLSDQHRPRLVAGVFDLLVKGMHRVTSICCLDSSPKNRYKANFRVKGGFCGIWRWSSFSSFLSLKNIYLPKDYFGKNGEDAQVGW